MPDRTPLTDEELEAISEKLLKKLLERVAGRARPLVSEPDNDVGKRNLEPTPEDYATVRAALRRIKHKQGKRSG
jgi:hypothetical protein